MVKGTSKRVVVVKSPDPKVFEQAIFVVREDFFGRHGKADALKEAQQVANEYIRSAFSVKKHLFSNKSLVWWITAGLSSAGIAALILFLVF